MAEEGWTRASFAGTAAAQADLVASLTPDARMTLLEELLAIAAASGALRRAREDKQGAIDEQWKAP